MPTYKRQEWLLDGEILIFILATAKKPVWQLRFRNPLNDTPRYIRLTTGTTSKPLATAKAIQKFQEYQSRALLGMRDGKCTIRQLLDEYGNQLSPTDRKMAEGFWRTYWSIKIGDDDISVYKTHDIEEYFRWRINYTIEKRKTMTRYWQPTPDSVSASTLKLERINMAKLFKLGVRHNLIARMPSFPEKFYTRDHVHRLPKNNRRAKINLETEYKGLLVPEFNRILRGLRVEENKPQLQNPELPFHPETNIWLSKAKRDVAEGREERMREYDCKIIEGRKLKLKEFTDQKSRYASACFRFLCLFLANTGVRVSEARKLQMKHIKLVRDENDGLLYTIVNIPRLISKIKKQRAVVAADFHKTYERFLEYKQEVEYYFNEEITEDSYLFPMPQKEKKWRYPRELIHNLVRPRLKELGLHTKPNPDFPEIMTFYSAYSFRSFYISQRLENGLDIYILSKNVGTSVATLASTYDYSENWMFRKHMTKHLKEMKGHELSDDQKESLSEYATNWSQDL